MKIKHQLLSKGLVPISAFALMTSCVDSKYDLTHIDASSEFKVNDLTVPLNLSQIKLENVIDLDDNENIKTLADHSGNRYYAISKDGDISTSDFNINPVSVNKLTIAATNLSIPVPSVGVSTSGPVKVPTITFGSSDEADYKFEMNNVDEALLALTNIKTKNPIDIKITLSIPRQLAGANNKITFDNLLIQLPWGLLTDDPHYNITNGEYRIPTVTVGADGTATVSLQAYGIQPGDKGAIKNGYLAISGQVKIVGGDLNMTVSNTALPGNISITANYDVPGFEIASVSGSVNYKMENIDIEPISLNDLPDFLDGPDTELRIANPAILIDIKNNPAGKYGLAGNGKLKLTSVFNNGQKVEHESDVFTLSGRECRIALGSPEEGYTHVGFESLGDILANNNTGLPNEIQVAISDIIFNGNVEDLPLGNIGKTEGDYTFKAPLGFADGSKVIYESTEDGWSGKDQLSDINIEQLIVNAICTTNLPVGVMLRILPVDKNGNEIAVDENSSLFEVPAFSRDKQVILVVKGIDGKTIEGIDGIKFVATVTQSNPGSEFTFPLGPDQFIMLDDLKVTVSGSYNYVEDKK